jgi:hypothetical protein
MAAIDGAQAIKQRGAVARRKSFQGLAPALWLMIAMGRVVLSEEKMHCRRRSGLYAFENRIRAFPSQTWMKVQTASARKNQGGCPSDNFSNE